MSLYIDVGQSAERCGILIFFEYCFISEEVYFKKKKGCLIFWKCNSNLKTNVNYFMRTHKNLHVWEKGVKAEVLILLKMTPQIFSMTMKVSYSYLKYLLLF